MDFHPPQDAHTSYLRTLSKIKGLRDFSSLAPQDISSEGAAYLTSFFASVNTSMRTFFLPPTRRFRPVDAFVVRFVSNQPSKGRASYIRFPFRQPLAAN